MENQNPLNEEEKPKGINYVKTDAMDDLETLFSTDLDGFDDVKINVYRCHTTQKNKEGRSFVYAYREVIDEERIGNDFGGGDYLITCRHNGKLYQKRFKIDEIYTRKLEEKKQEENSDSKKHGSNLNEFELFEKVANLVKTMMEPIIQQISQNKNTQQTPDYEKMLQGIMKTVTVGTIENMQQMARALTEKQIEKINAPPPEIPEEKAGLLREVVDLLKENIGTILNAGPLKTALIKNGIKESEEARQVVDDPQMLDLVYTLMVQDPEIGEDKANNIFKKLGYEIPEENTSDVPQN